jgi:hypothetical protein
VRSSIHLSITIYQSNVVRSRVLRHLRKSMSLCSLALTPYDSSHDADSARWFTCPATAPAEPALGALVSLVDVAVPHSDDESLLAAASPLARFFLRSCRQCSGGVDDVDVYDLGSLSRETGLSLAAEWSRRHHHQQHRLGPSVEESSSLCPARVGARSSAVQMAGSTPRRGESAKGDRSRSRLVVR